MKFINLLKPEYLRNPKNIFRKFFCKIPLDVTKRRLIWKDEIIVNPNEGIGRNIYETGFHDIDVCEIIARILKKGDNAIDAGANIGFITSLMSHLVGKEGKIFSFECNPIVYKSLLFNIKLFKNSNVITPYSFALSNKTGEALLNLPSNFNTNQWTAYISGSKSANSIVVQTKTLDEIFINTVLVFSLMKLDVEGYEFEVLEGTQNLIESGRIKNIVFENHSGNESKVNKFLIDRHFQIYGIKRDLLKVRLIEGHSKFKCYNFLATLDEQATFINSIKWQLFKNHK